MPTIKDISVEDEAYLASVIAEPKMTMDEVGADIDFHGHVPVTPDNATQDPFTAKGMLATALDESINAEEGEQDFRDETVGEIEGIEIGEPMVQQDSAKGVKDSLADALDPIAMDAKFDLTDYTEENASFIKEKAPDVPKSLGGSEDKPDENGLVYVSATFTVDPDKYVSNNYRPANMGKMPDAVAELKKASGAMKNQSVNPEEEAELSDLGSQEDEPTDKQEDAAAKDADKEQKEEIEVAVKEEPASVIPTPKEDDKPAQDEAPEKVALDYATFIDGSSFICYDEVADIDYSKIAMDAGPKKAPTRSTCQTTFAQCRAKNPLFCRFHGPKLLEADIKTAIKATVGPGCVVQVTKDKNAKNKFTFRLTVGCPPAKKKMVEWIVHNYLTSNPGISSSTEDWNLVGKHKQTQEFEMDLLQVDKPPQKNTKGDQMLSNTKKAIIAHKKQEVVGETPSALEKKAAKGEKWGTVDEAVETEWGELIRDHIQTSGITNNNEFLVNFNKIANQFDAAHDAGDANGLKQALEALKKEVGKYDEVTGAKKPEAEAVEKEETTEEPESPEAPESEAQNGQAGNQDQSDEDSWKDDMEEEWHQAVSNEAQKKFSSPSQGAGNGSSGEKEKPLAVNARADYEGYEEEDKGKLLQHLNKVLSGEGFPEDVDEIPEGEPYSRRVCSAQWLDAVDSIKDKVPSLVKALTAIKDSPKKDEKANGGETTVLPAPNAASKGKESQNPSTESNDPSSYGENAISSLQHELSGLMEKMQSIGATTDADVFAMQHMCNYHMEELNAAKASLDEIEAKIKSTSDEDSTSDPFAAAMSMSVLKDAKKKAQEAVDENIAQVQGSIKQFTDSLYSYEKATMETAKKGAADSVEQTIKNLGVSVFGGKRPPQGVDSVTDYLDYLKDELESGAAGTLTPDEQSEIEDKYSLEDAYKATKAASKAMDDAIEEFKDKMDEVPSQGEDYGTYQADIEQMKKAIALKAVEIMAAFSAYKQAIEKCKYEADAAKKLAESKKKLGGGGVQGNKGGEEPKQSAQPSPQAQQKSTLTDEEKKAKIAAMSPKQKLEAAIKIFKKKLAKNPNDETANAKLSKYEAMLAKLGK
ncbi:MAG: hypothetical protein J6Q22_09705 [Prevotella sp.]|nr:hypothetical protein [Prevotella sp.]